MLKGIQYDASRKMEGASISEMDPIMENSDLIDAFFAACNDYMYNKSDLNTASNSFYDQAVADYFS